MSRQQIHIMPIQPEKSFLLMPRRGLSCKEAAAYIGLGQSKFIDLILQGKMPQPVRVDHRTIWDIKALDAAFDILAETQTDRYDELQSAVIAENSWEGIIP